MDYQCQSKYKYKWLSPLPFSGNPALAFHNYYYSIHLLRSTTGITLYVTGTPSAPKVDNAVNRYQQLGGTTCASASSSSSSASMIENAARMEQEEDDLKLSVELWQGIGEAGVKELTPLQRRAISALVEGKDVVVDAGTGRGKTTAMVIGILQRIAAQGRKDAMQVLVVVPVRELTVVTDHIVRVLGVHMDLTTQPVVVFRQNHNLLANAQVVTITPGRLRDLLERGFLDPEQVRMLVFDDPGRMVDMGFADEIDFIIKFLPTDIQLAIFTDSMTDGCKDLAEAYMSHPVYITYQ